MLNKGWPKICVACYMERRRSRYPDIFGEVVIINIDQIECYCQDAGYNTRLVVTKLGSKNLIIDKSIIMAVTISTSEFVTGSLGVVDHATGNAISGATFANVNFSSSDSNIFTTAPNASDPNSVDVTGINGGTGTLLVTADVTYTDPNTGQTVNQAKTANVSVTVTPGASTTDLVVNFGTPQPKTA